MKSTDHSSLTRHLLPLLAALCLPHAVLAETIPYTNGTNRTAPIELTEDAILTIDDGTATQSGAISEVDGSFGITKAGAGTLVIENVDDEYNFYTGGTVVEAGTLRMGSAYAIQFTAVTIYGGATFDLGGYGTELNALSGAGTLEFGGGYFYLYSGGAFAGALTGGGNFIYNGPDTFTLSGDSDYSTGSLSVYSGRLASTGTSTFGGLSLDDAEFAVTGGSTVISSYVYVNSSNPVKLEVTGGGSLEITEGLWIGSFADASGKVAVTGTGSHLKVSDIEISDAGTGALTLSAGGKLTVDTGTGTVQLALSSGGSGTLSIGAAAGDPAAAPGIVNARRIDTDDGTGHLVFNHTGTDYHFTKDGTPVGAAVRITGATQVVVENGVTTLTGTNTYSGGTVVTGGMLFIIDVGEGNSVLGTGALQVGENGALGGSGTVLGDTTVAGLFSPGHSTGQITFEGDLTLQTTAITLIEIGGTSDYDRFIVDGALTYGGTLSISFLDDFAPADGAEFALFEGDGVISGYSGPVFSAITFSAEGYAGSFDYDTGVLTVNAVPEPAACALLGAALLALALRRRRSHAPLSTISSIATPGGLWGDGVPASPSRKTGGNTRRFWQNRPTNKPVRGRAALPTLPGRGVRLNRKGSSVSLPRTVVSGQNISHSTFHIGISTPRIGVSERRTGVSASHIACPARRIACSVLHIGSSGSRIAVSRRRTSPSARRITVSAARIARSAGRIGSSALHIGLSGRRIAASGSRIDRSVQRIGVPASRIEVPGSRTRDANPRTAFLRRGKRELPEKSAPGRANIFCNRLFFRAFNDFFLSLEKRNSFSSENSMTDLRVILPILCDRRLWRIRSFHRP